MAQVLELVDRKAKFVVGTKHTSSGEYTFTIQGLVEKATADQIATISDALNLVFDGEVNEAYAIDSSRVVPPVQD